MADETGISATGAAGAGQASTAFKVAIAAVVLWLAAFAFAGDDDAGAAGMLWPLAGLTGGVAAVMAWKAGRPRPAGRALTALLLGGLVFVAIVGWTLVALITGEEL